MVTQREAIELSLAKREIVETNVVLISIPEYYAQGLQLYSNFSDRIAEQLGADRTKELMKDIDAVVRANNASFGDQKQEILVHDLGDSVEILHGSGALMRINGQISTVKVTSKSQLLKNNLLKYQYLKPLFPNNSVDEPQ